MSVSPARRPLNKDEVVTEGDILGYYVNGQWISDLDSAAVSKLTPKEKTEGRGIAHRVVYADGRTETWLRNEGQPATQTMESGQTGYYGTVINRGVEPDVRKDWDARVDKEVPKEQTPAQQSQDAATIELNNQRSYNLNNGGLFETHEARREREKTEAKENQPKTTTAAVKGGDGKDYIRAVQINPDGSIKSITNYDLGTGQTVASVPGVTAQPTVSTKEVQNPDGSTKNVRVLQFPPDAANPNGREVVEASAVPGKPAEPGATLRESIRGPDNKPYTKITRKDPVTGQASVTYENEAGEVVPAPGKSEGGGFNPKVPDWSADLRTPDLGVRARKAQLQQLVTSGVITPAEALEQMQFDLSMATAEAKNAGAIVDIQRGNQRADLEARGQDITDASSRRSFAGSTFNQTMGTLGPVASSLLPGNGDVAARGFMAALNLAQQFAANMGGMAQPRAYNPSQYPMLGPGGFGGIGLPPSPAGAALQQAAPQPQTGGVTINVQGGTPAAGAPAVSAQPAAPAPAAPAAPAPAVEDMTPEAFASPMGQQMRRAWATQATPDYDPRQTGLLDDMLSAGFEPDALAAAAGNHGLGIASGGFGQG